MNKKGRTISFLSGRAECTLVSMRRLPRSVSFWLPVANIFFAAGLVVIPALLFFFRLKNAARGTGFVFLSAGEFQLKLTPNQFLSHAFISSTYRAERLLTTLNTSGSILDLLLAIIGEYTGRWYHQMAFIAWPSVTYPLFAAPAWYYCGRGLDSLITRSSVTIANMVTSCFFSLLCLVNSFGLRFALSSAERQGRVTWIIEGFALWSVLLTTPLLAWLQQRRRTRAV